MPTVAFCHHVAETLKEELERNVDSLAVAGNEPSSSLSSSNLSKQPTQQEANPLQTEDPHHLLDLLLASGLLEVGSALDVVEARILDWIAIAEAVPSLEQIRYKLMESTGASGNGYVQWIVERSPSTYGTRLREDPIHDRSGKHDLYEEFCSCEAPLFGKLLNVRVAELKRFLFESR